MKFDFDQDTGRLRFDGAGFDALYAVATGEAPSDEAATAMHDAGISDGTTIAPAIEPGLWAIAHSVVGGQLAVIDHAGRSWGVRIWVAAEAAAYLLSASDLLDELIITGPRFVPGSIARIVGLGPRAHPAFTSWTIPIDHLDHLISATESERQRIAETVQPADDDTAAFITSIVDGPWHYWTLDVAWDAAAGQESQRGLYILDTTHGMAALTHAGDDISVDPMTPTEVWLALTMILPDDDELAQPA